MMSETTLTKLKQKFGADGLQTSQFRDNVRVIAPPANLYSLLECLKVDCGFDMLVDVTAVDYLHYPEAKDRFGIIYALLQTTTGERLYVKTYVNDVLPKLEMHLDKAQQLQAKLFEGRNIPQKQEPTLR